MNVMCFNMQFPVYPVIGFILLVVNLVYCSLLVTTGLAGFSLEKGHADLHEL